MSQSDKILAQRYAKALFGLAMSAGVEDQVADDLSALKHLFDSSVDFRRLLNNPIISKHSLVEIIDSVLNKIKAQELSFKTTETLIENNRIMLLPGLAVEYMDMLATHKGEVSVEIVSAIKLQDQHIASIEKALGAALGKKIKLHTKVDATIIGGLIVKIGSKMIDGSVLSQLNKIRIQSIEAIMNI